MDLTWTSWDSKVCQPCAGKTQFSSTIICAGATIGHIRHWGQRPWAPLGSKTDGCCGKTSRSGRPTMKSTNLGLTRVNIFSRGQCQKRTPPKTIARTSTKPGKILLRKWVPPQAIVFAPRCFPNKVQTSACDSNRTFSTPKIWKPAKNDKAIGNDIFGPPKHQFERQKHTISKCRSKYLRCN